MHKFIKTITNKKVSKKIWFTLLILIIYKIGINLTVPGTYMDNINFASSSAFTLMNMFGGGALSKYSVFALGISPYITAGIVVQLLAMGVIPKLTDWQEEGENGKRKTEKVTRWMGFFLALVQAFALTYGLDKQYGLLVSNTYRSYILTTAILTAGSMVLVWLGDMITMYGIGNGISMIIAAGILTSLPNTFLSTGAQIFANGVSVYPIAKFAGYILLYLFLILGTIVIEGAEKRIPVRYASSGTTAAGSKMSYLPIKLNTAGVLPIIFAQTLISVPLTIVSMFSSSVYTKMSKILSFNNASGIIIYGLLTFGFAFLYTHMILDENEMAKNLTKSQGFIPGVRSGKDTAKHIADVVNKATIFGAIAITFMAVLPYILGMISSLSTVSALGGTGIIIIVGVTTEALSQLDTVVVENKYSTWLKK